MIATIYLLGESAVRSFSDHSLVSADPVKLAETMTESDVDAILCFDLSEAADTELQKASLRSLTEICSAVHVPVYAGGNIVSFFDVTRLFEAGASKVILNFGKSSSQEIIEEVSSQYGRDAVAVTIASEDSLVINKQLLESTAGELILIDEHAMKNCLGASNLPCIVYLPEVSLDKMFSTLQKDVVSGISGNVVNENINQIGALKRLAREQGIDVCIFEPAIPFSELKKGPDGLVPCIVQDYQTGQVLMMAYMNEEAYLRTLRTEKMTYYSRSRRSLWIKGETSGHFQFVKQLCIDCDNDTLLAKVKQVGAACHTGNYSCFYRDLIPPKEILPQETRVPDEETLSRLEDMDSKLHSLMDEWTTFKNGIFDEETNGL
ncbi:MAG: phosphoribosyl-AMP cyclohydrolase [Lachnospiraceae bacterium]|nr:phosphoribosyl-AMP cyclohydrolase [Lachnospiraceae bacterium]